MPDRRLPELEAQRSPLYEQLAATGDFRRVGTVTSITSILLTG